MSLLYFPLKNPVFFHWQAVQAFILEHGRPPVVLDIGCGTGLLSMLAVRGGAEEVIGCELYEPLAQVAREVTELNCPGKIKVSFSFSLNPIRPTPTFLAYKLLRISVG